MMNLLYDRKTGHVIKVGFVANLPIRNILPVQKLRKSFEIGICPPRKVFGSIPFEFLKTGIFA